MNYCIFYVNTVTNRTIACMLNVLLKSIAHIMDTQVSNKWVFRPVGLYWVLANCGPTLSLAVLWQCGRKRTRCYGNDHTWVYSLVETWISCQAMYVATLADLLNRRVCVSPSHPQQTCTEQSLLSASVVYAACHIIFCEAYHTLPLAATFHVDSLPKYEVDSHSSWLFWRLNICLPPDID